MATSGTPVPVPPTHTKGQVIDAILHDIISFGIIAASIFVKNEKSKATAGAIIQNVIPLLPILDEQITGQPSTITLPPQQTPTS